MVCPGDVEASNDTPYRLREGVDQYEGASHEGVVRLDVLEEDGDVEYVLWLVMLLI